MMEKISLTDLRRQFFGPTLDESFFYGVDAVVERMGVSNRDGKSGQEDQHTKHGRKHSQIVDDLQLDGENVTSADALYRSDKRNSAILEDKHRKISVNSSQSDDSKRGQPSKPMNSEASEKVTSDYALSKICKLTKTQNELKEEKRVSIDSSSSSTKSHEHELTKAKDMENRERRASVESTSIKSNRGNGSKESVKARRMSSHSNRMNIVSEVVESFGETDKTL